jgi:predicted nucleic acid-binding protein
MNAIFADTFFFLALLNPKDEAHSKALPYIRQSHPFTTAWVLTEVGDAYSAPENRRAFLRLLEILKNSKDIRVENPSEELFNLGIQFFGKRLDKEWSVTDCISFVVMEKIGVTDALTGDRHFEQAGFRALLR